MCSIIGYRGSSLAVQVIIAGLQRMEYRGYDSAGVATLFRNQIHVRKGVGRVKEVRNSLELDSMPGVIGIGHTRWATHGGVNDVNAHPHSSDSNQVAIVHNGIIENYLSLKHQLRESGFRFVSQTDSEVIANLLQEGYVQSGSVKEAMQRTVSRLSGSYAFIAMFDNGTIAAARNHEPLIVGVGQNEYYISSDVLGFVDYTDDAVFLGDEEIVVVDASGMHFLNFQGISLQPRLTKIAHDSLDAEKGEFSHFTIKEIFEQPLGILKASDDKKPEYELFLEYLRKSKNLFLTGSGTSYHASLVGSYILSKYAGRRAEPLIASEVQYSPHILDQDAVLLALSQSGESADVLNAVSIAKRQNAKVISIVNSMTSSLVRESLISLGLNCGPEIGVAATKSFTAQLALIYRLADTLSGGKIVADFPEISRNISKVLFESSKIQKISEEFRLATDIYVLGRGVHFPIALEGSLKIKEITYIHAEGLPGGELKHGPLALIHKGVYVIVINPHDSTYEDTLTGANEIKSRGGKIIGISDRPNDLYDQWIEIPPMRESLHPIVETVPLQLLAYYASLERNADPDYPRNLAKCVTVK